LKTKIIITLAIGVFVIIFGVALGSVYIPLGDIARIFLHKIFGANLPENLTTSAAIMWSLRLPRVLLAFTAGAALSVSGAVMQSVLRNPLACRSRLGCRRARRLARGSLSFSA